MNKKAVIVLAGPTASGKSEMGLAFHKLFPEIEIVNGDPFQCYKELELPTCAPSETDKFQAPHHLYSFLPVTQAYDIHAYQKDARETIDKLLSENKIPLLISGSGLYLRSALYSYNFLLEEEDKRDDLDIKSDEELFKLLEEIDPEESRKLHPNNRVRVLRAIRFYNYHHISKTDYLKDNKAEPIYDIIGLYVTRDRDELYRRADLRVDKLFEENLPEYVSNLFKKYGTECPAFKAIGVKEFIPWYKGERSLEEVKNNIKLNTRHYIKRQETFFRHQFNFQSIHGFEEAVKYLRGTKISEK